MGYFPFYIDIENKNCIIIGGGTVALRKLEKLREFKPVITVIAPDICDEINRFADIKIIKRKFEDRDINNAFMVISATDDKELNTHIFALCKEKNILINTVDDKDKCGFIFPALVKKDNITVGISTSGKSPLYSRFLRERIEKLLDEDCDKTVEILSKYRAEIKRRVKSEENRKKAFEMILDLCIRGTENIDDELILKITEGLDK